MLTLVVVQHLVVVHLVNVVAGEDEDIFRVVHVDEVDVLIDGVRGALVPGALLAGAQIGGQHMDAAVRFVQVPGLAVAQIGVELHGAVLGQYAYRINAGVDAVGQGKVNDPVLGAEGDGGFCHVAGQRVQPGALSAGQQHGDTFLLHVHSPLYYYDSCRLSHA